MKKPLVSVLMTAFNAEEYICESINSILNQTYSNIELIIVNDGSTDSTEDKILSFSDSRIKYYKNKHNLKISLSLNIAINECSGTYIARMDSDDISINTRIEKQVTFLEQNPQIDICGTALECFGNCKKEIRRMPLNHEAIKAQLILSSSMCHATVLAKAYFFKSNQYSDNYVGAEDYYLWIQNIDKFIFGNLNEVLYLYRRHPKQLTQASYSSKENKRIKVQKIILDRVFENKEIFDPNILKTTNDIINFYTKLEKANERTKYVSLTYLNDAIFRDLAHRVSLKNIKSLYKIMRSPYKKLVFIKLFKISL